MSWRAVYCLKPANINHCIHSNTLIFKRHNSQYISTQSKYIKSYKTHDKFFNQTRHLRTNIITHDNTVISPFEDIQLSDCLIHESIWRNVDKWPEKDAIECGVTKRKYTYSQLHKYSKRFAASLLKSCFRPGDIISILLPNSPEYPFILLGALEAGLIVSTINPAYNADEIYRQLIASPPVCIVTYDEKLNAVRNATVRCEQQKSLKPIRIISDSVSGSSGDWSLQEMIHNDIDMSSLDALTRTGNKTTALLPYSSGTTGLPKGVCLTHSNIVSNLETAGMDPFSLNLDLGGNHQEVSVAVLPFFHLYGLAIILLQQLRTGGKIVTLPSFDPKMYINVFHEHNVTILHLVPPLLMFIGTHPNVKKTMFRHVHDIFSAAAPLRESEIKLFMHHFPEDVVIRQGYGLTETSPFITITPREFKSLATIGQPIFNTEVKIINQNGDALGTGEHGEICARGPQVMKGYLNNDEATSLTIDKDGWIHTGDIGYYDKNGYFYIVDRIKEIIKVKGFQVAPAELEELLRCHPKVVDAAVIGVPDEKTDETPIAYVVAKQNHKSLQPEELINYIAENVTKYKRISKVIFVDTIPKSVSGKILRRTLKDRYVKEC